MNYKYSYIDLTAKYRLSYWRNSDGTQASFPLHLRFGVPAQSCTVSSSNYTVDMGTIPSTRFIGIGTEVIGSPFNITVNCPDSSVGVSGLFSDFSDFSNLNNTSSYLNLTPDSTAKGVKVQLMYDDTVITYDSPSEAGYSLNGVAIKNPGSSRSQTFTVVPKYVQTSSKVTGGTANAVSVLTFIYD